MVAPLVEQDSLVIRVIDSPIETSQHESPKATKTTTTLHKEAAKEMMDEINRAIILEQGQADSLNSKIELGLVPYFEALPMCFADPIQEDSGDKSYGIGRPFDADKVIRTKAWDCTIDREKFYNNRSSYINNKKSDFDMMPKLS
jgi:hypothetical protein